MIMTSMAVMDVAVRWRSVRERFFGSIGHHENDGGIVVSDDRAEAYDDASERQPDLVAMPAPAERNLWRWRRHPQLRVPPGFGALCAHERRARHSAVHGLYAAMAGDIDDASAWFLQAVSIHDIDLTEIPSFWQMPRAAIEAAAVAYECVGRFREAAVVQARLRTEFRPRNVIELHATAAGDAVPLEAAAR